MEITLKLYASLSDYLPEGSEKHTTRIDIQKDATAYSVIDRFQVPREMAHLVLLNGVYLQPAERDKPALHDGDTLAVWPPVAGG